MTRMQAEKRAAELNNHAKKTYKSPAYSYLAKRSTLREAWIVVQYLRGKFYKVAEQ